LIGLSTKGFLGIRLFTVNDAPILEWSASPRIVP
jgi:hypothetical protein